MPVDRSLRLSISQMGELLGFDPDRFAGIEVDRRSSQVTICLEPTEQPMPQPFNRVEFADAMLSIVSKANG